MKTAIRKVGNSHAVIIPKPLLAEIGAKAEDRVDMSVQGGKIVEHSASRNDLLLLNQLGLVSGTQPMTEATWRKPVAPSSLPPG